MRILMISDADNCSCLSHRGYLRTAFPVFFGNRSTPSHASTPVFAKNLSTTPLAATHTASLPLMHVQAEYLILSYDITHFRPPRRLKHVERNIRRHIFQTIWRYANFLKMQMFLIRCKTGRLTQIVLNLQHFWRAAGLWRIAGAGREESWWGRRSKSEKDEERRR